MKRTKVCDLLGIKYPIIQAPMVWITGADLAAAVSNAGGLGTIGFNAGAKTITPDINLTGERLRDQIRKAKQLTDKPFAVNFAAVPKNPFSDRCIEVALEEGIAAAVLVGDFPEPYTGRLRQAGVKVLFRPMVKVNVEAAKRAETAGADAVIIVGCESGGHSGIDQLSTMVLVPQVVDAVKVPVIGGGGIGDSRGVAAVLSLGAEGVFVGTAFMATTECDTHQKVKESIINVPDTCTVTWIGQNGLVRALKNKFTDEVFKMKSQGIADKEINKFCYAADKFRPGLVEGNVDEFFIPLGAAAGLIKGISSAGKVVQDLCKGL